MPLQIRDLATSSLAKQHYSYYDFAPHHARGMFTLEVNRNWGLHSSQGMTSPFDRIQILVLGFNDETGLGAQAHKRQVHYSRYVRSGHGKGRRLKDRS
jgi:hypothetical protein